MRTLWVLVLLVFALVLGAALMVGPWLRQFMLGPQFRAIVEEQLGKKLDATVTILPLRRSDDSLFSGEIRVVPNANGDFQEAVASEVRMRIDPPGFGHWHWGLRNVEVARLDIDASKRATSLLPKMVDPTPVVEMKPPPFWVKWLPMRVVAGPAVVREFTVRWGAAGKSGGSLEKTALTIEFPGDRIDVRAAGGKFHKPGLPVADLREASARFLDDRLSIISSELSVGQGRVKATGEVDFQNNTRLDLRLDFQGIALEPFLVPDWRARISGNMEGTAHVRGTAEGEVTVEGKAEGRSMVITALPVLDQLALFTTLTEFRRLPLQRAGANYFWREGELKLTDLHVEAEGLFLVRGDLTIRGNQLEGNLATGLTPRSLQWLPGVEESVFTQVHDRYRVTLVQISGTLQDPKEDLTVRLVAAIAKRTVDKAGAVAAEVTRESEKLPGRVLEAGDMLLRLLQP